MHTVCQVLLNAAMFVNEADQIPTLVGLTYESSFDCQQDRIYLVREHDGYHL